MGCFSGILRGWMVHDKYHNGEHSEPCPIHGNQITKSGWLEIKLTSGIPPGGNFTYVVPIDEDNQWGTYWVHAHSSVSPSSSCSFFFFSAITA